MDVGTCFGLGEATALEEVLVFVLISTGDSCVGAVGDAEKGVAEEGLLAGMGRS